ncbi:MAG TPA: NnrU family protein [Myxococcota bacterium]|jgi:uncharacterized membrane protein|nr:NnrU family protein [Myxococcota bacterium]
MDGPTADGGAVALGLALLWLGFGGSHVLLSSLRVRRRLVAALGTVPFLGLYSVVALAFFVPLVRLYFAHKHAGPLLWTPGVGDPARVAIYGGMGLAFVLVVSGLLQPGPAGVVPGSLVPRGVYRLTRHPQNMGIALFGALHLVPNGFASDVVFFGGVAAFAILGSWHQDARKRVDGPRGYAEFVARTPFWPFTGRETVQGLRELSPLAVALGVGAAWLVRHFHARWFGG